MVTDDPPSEEIAPIASPEPDALLARRAQILATEHWGLLAARSTAQSEVLTRITIYLTLVSAGLVTISILGQASRFSDWFGVASLAILGFLSLVGLMTQTRVLNVAEEDLMYVVAMNRLRGAYVDLDPGVEKYFLAAIADDLEGSLRTYSFLRRRGFSHLFGSSAVLIVVVNSCVCGLLVGAVARVADVPLEWAAAVAVLVATALAVVFMVRGRWTYAEAWRNHMPLRRTAPTETTATDRPR